MARSKRSTALYEVINVTRQPTRLKRVRQNTLWNRTKIWWNKAKPVFRSVADQEQPDPTDIAPAETADQMPPPAIEPAVIAEVSSPPSKPVDIAVDPHRRQIALHLSYGTAALAAGALVLIVLLSVAVGRYITRNSVPLLAETTTAAIQKGPAHPDVLYPLPRHVSNTPTEQATGALQQHISADKTQNSTVTTPAMTPPEQGKRTVGLNYVIIQSYPEKELKMANDAAAFLNGHGVDCSVEKGIDGFLTYCVVGMTGFPRQSSPEFKDYVQRIAELSKEYTGKNSRKFKQFSPVAKKWTNPE